VTRVKICGITDLGDACAAASAGADYLGLVFYPPSPRAVSPDLGREIVGQTRLHHPRARFAGVFVDEPVERVWKFASHCGLDIVQLHGEEPPHMVAELIARGLDVIKAFRVQADDALVRARRYRPTLCLLDTFVPDRPGGSGQTFDWALAAQAALPAPVLLAGGLTAENVTGAMRVGRPWGVDVSSGVERAPGRKDPDKLRRFIAAVRLTDGGYDIEQNSNH
jgi:phosphoribosylanthranilate isomerase